MRPPPRRIALWIAAFALVACRYEHFEVPPPEPGPRCGDGHVDDGERCDGDCPTACDDGDPCTRDRLEAAGTCQATCTTQAILETAHGDGCCPLRADRWSDDDCAPICGDGIVDAGEYCDDGELLETPDASQPCPDTCDDADVCTVDHPDDRLTICQPLFCQHTPVRAVDDRDGCCPPGLTAAADLDCVQLCGGRAGSPCPVPALPCDLTGSWIAEQHLTFTWSAPPENVDLTEHLIRWSFYRVRQFGDRVTIDDAVDCGFHGDGFIASALDDAALAAMATRTIAAPNGTYRVRADHRCDFELARSYQILGANPATYLDDVWRPGDPPLALGAFPALPTAAPGLEDWDLDGNPGLTISSIFPRFVAQRSWSEQSGITLPFAIRFGDGPGIAVRWDAQEYIVPGAPLPEGLRSKPLGDGWARYARTTLDISDRLRLCHAVQILARRDSTWTP